MKKLIFTLLTTVLATLCLSVPANAAAVALPFEPGPAAKIGSETAEQNNRENAGTAQISSSSSSVRTFLTKLENSSEIPTVCVYTKNNAEVVSRQTYVDCEVYTINCDDEYRIDGAAAGIRVRGNSTAYEGNVEMIRANPVPYRIKFEKKRSMFGLNNDAKCKSWVLLKGDYDLLKNDIAFRIGRNILRNGNFCSDGIPVHLYLNGKFVGIYEICEQHQVNKHRVNIYETPEGYEGIDTGYFVELDTRCEQPFFKVNYAGNPRIVDANGVSGTLTDDAYTIKSDFYSNDQKEFIAKYINNCFKIIYNACEKDKYYVFDENYDLVKASKKVLKKTGSDGNPIDPAEIVSDLAVDLESFVDIFLIYELTMSRDVGEGSFFMCADFSDPDNIKKLTFTCPWDFEWSMMGDTTGSYAKVFNDTSFSSVFGERSNPWYIVLMKQDWFVDKVRERWTVLRTARGKSGTNTIDKCISQERKLLKKYKTDFCKNGTGDYYSAEALIKWVEKRVAWMDKEYMIK